MFCEFNDVIFRKYDLRGVYNKDFNSKDMYNFAKCFSSVLIERQVKRHICIGFDGRKSSPEIFTQLKESFLESGINVTSLGLVSSPMLFRYAHENNFDAAIMITASHNPKEYNGLKIEFNRQSFSDFWFLDIKRFAKNGILKGENCGLFNEIDFYDEYINFLLSYAEIIRPLNFCFDCGNGATGKAVEMLINRLKIKFPNSKFDAIYTEIDSENPKHPADPSIAENLEDLRQLMLKKQETKDRYELGFAFDGDGDRLGVIDDLCRITKPEQWGFPLVVEICQKNNHKIVLSYAMGWSFRNFLQYREETNMCAIFNSEVGHSNMKDNMRIFDAAFGIESSGHVFYQENYNIDDALFAAVKMMTFISKNNASLAYYCHFMTKVYYNTVNILVDEKDKFNIINNAKNLFIKSGKNLNLNTEEGILFEEHNRCLIRPSNTSNKIQISIETTNKENITKLSDEIKILLNKAIEVIKN